jgi:hypothetical protein
LTKYALPTIRALAPVGCLLEKLPPEVNLAKERHLLQVLPLKQELCAVPEMIFSPLDANVPQLPLHAAVMLALERPGTMLKHCRFLHATLLRNVVAFGGTTRLDGMTKRLAAELQSGCTVEVRVLPSASTCPNLISSSDASVAEDFRRKPVDEAAGLVGTEALEPLIGGVYLCRHTRLLALAEQRSKVSRVDALAAAPSEERPGIRKGMWLLLRAAQLLL